MPAPRERAWCQRKTRCQLKARSFVASKNVVDVDTQRVGGPGLSGSGAGGLCALLPVGPGRRLPLPQITCTLKNASHLKFTAQRHVGGVFSHDQGYF